MMPRVSQIIWGGVPRRHTKSTKSLSFVMITALTVRESSKISISFESLNPRSRSAEVSMLKVLVTQFAKVGGN